LAEYELPIISYRSARYGDETAIGFACHVLDRLLNFGDIARHG
jgi:hypothetical protein